MYVVAVVQAETFATKNISQICSPESTLNSTHVQFDTTMLSIGDDKEPIPT